MDTLSYLIFFTPTLIMLVIPIMLITFVVLLVAKIYKKESWGENLFSLLPFWGLLILFYFVLASLWDRFVEGPGKLFQYWDQIPWMGFYLFSHDHPRADSLKTDLAPGVNLITLDLIWLSLLIAMYVLPIGIFWKLKRNKDASLRNAVIISIILFVIGCVLGLNQGAAKL